METRIFVFDMMGDRLVILPQGGGTVVNFDDLCSAEGWAPLHWTDMSQEQRIRYRVIMRRQKPQP